MSLNKEQYDKLMLAYSRRRDRHREELRDRRRKIYAQIPGYRDLDRKVPELSADALEARLSGTDTGEPLSSRLHKIAEQKRSLLVHNGYPADYLEPQYDCPDCRDTGYIDGRKCRCFRRQELRILYQQSHLERLLTSNRFDLLSREYYQGEDLVRFDAALATCRSFIESFPRSYENLFFYGTVGTGKSFLSISTAGELLQQGTPVLYFSSAGLFETLSSCAFRQEEKPRYQSLLQDLYTCELLVIDDLGTEMVNHFVSTQLFALLTERDINRKSTIISTNLSLPELRERYSDRIFSRITSNFTVRKLTGPDVRIIRKMRHLEQP